MVAVLGDGAYMFANPTACHFVAAGAKLPVLTVIYNNACTARCGDRRWTCIRDSMAAEADGRRLAELGPARRTSLWSKRMAGTASGSTHPAELPAALARAAAAVRAGRQAVVNVLCPGGMSGGMSERRTG